MMFAKEGRLDAQRFNVAVIPHQSKTMISFRISEPSVGGIGFFAIAYGIVIFIVHVVMACVVNGDAKQLIANRGGTFLFGSFLWGWIVFIFGLAGLALYWAIHHSTLRSNTPPNAR